MIEFAKPEMQPALSLLWQECFHDPAQYPDFFLSRISLSRDCLTDIENGKLAAAVYFLPAQIYTGEKTLQSHYVFAAATTPSFRSRGLMSALLARMAEEGAKRGDCFSAVLPSDEGLYRFYAAAGYRSFFRVRLVDAARERLQALADGSLSCVCAAPELSCLNACRRQFLSSNSGSLLWDDRMLGVSLAVSRTYGDQLVCAGEGAAFSYALCRTEGTVCTVLEMAAESKACPALLAEILEKAPAKHYRFRLPVGNGPFPGEGEFVPFGMLKPLGGRSLADAGARSPYLGLGMD